MWPLVKQAVVLDINKVLITLRNHTLSFGSFQYKVGAWQKMMQKSILLCVYPKKNTRK